MHVSKTSPPTAIRGGQRPSRRFKVQRARAESAPRSQGCVYPGSTPEQSLMYAHHYVAGAKEGNFW